MPPRPLFTAAMELVSRGAGRYAGTLDEHWTIGPKVHGGAMLALCANAARTEVGGQPIAVSANFLSAPDPGPMQLVTTVHKKGRRISVVDVELSGTGHGGSPAGQKVAVRATITLGEPEHHVPPLLSLNPVVPRMAPEPPPDVAPIGPGHPLANLVHLAHGCDIRPALHTMRPNTRQAPVFEYWVRPRGVAPDALFALLCGDISAPVTFAVERTGWAPTVQLTAFLRALPADGWLRVMSTAVQIGQDWFDEDHTVVDCEGRIIVQSRQLAMVPAAVD